MPTNNTARQIPIETDVPFVQSVAIASSDSGAFGSWDSVSAIVRDAIDQFLKLDNTDPHMPDQAEAIARAIGYQFISEGGRPESDRIGTWFVPGAIDVWLREHEGISETKPGDVLTAFFIHLFGEIVDVVEFAGMDGVLDEQWTWQIDALITDSVNSLLGYDVPDDSPKEPLELTEEVLNIREGWVTINTDENDEGGQKIYIDDKGVIQSGHFTGKSIKQAFGGGDSAPAKSDATPAKPGPKASPIPAKEAPKAAAPKPGPSVAAAKHDFSSIMGGKSKSTNDMLNDYASGIDKDSMPLMFDNVPKTEHEALTKAIGQANPKMAKAAIKHHEKLKAESAKWQASKEANAAKKASPAEKAKPQIDLSLPKDANEIRTTKVGDSTIVMNVNSNGKVELASLRTPVAKRGNGSASKAMAELTSQADKSNTTLHLTASPLDNKTHRSKLVAFYQKHGFELTGTKGNPAGDPDMVRVPKKAPPAAAPKPSKVPPVPSGLDSFEAEKAAKWKQAVDAGKADTIAKAGALNGIESDEAKAYHAALLKSAGVKKQAVSKEAKPIPSAPTDPKSTRQLADDFESYMNHHSAKQTLAYDEYDFAKLPKEHQTEFNALSAFVAGGFTGMNADPKHPASVKLGQMLDKIPDAAPKAMYRVLAFDNDAARQKFVESIAKPHGQEKAFSSWTKDDPSVKGASAKNHIGLDVASQFGEHELILKYENPKGAKDISFAYGNVSADAGTEYLLRHGHQMETKSIAKDVNGRTVVTVGPPAAPVAKPPAAKASPVYKSKAAVSYEAGDHAAFTKIAGANADPGSIVGAPHDAEVEVSVFKGTSGGYAETLDIDEDTPVAIISISGKGSLRAERAIYVDPVSKKKIMENVELDSGTSPPGTGRAMLRNQISAAKAAGVSEIRTWASGDADDSYNGYYTWPRYGYDAPVSAIQTAKLRAAVAKDFPEAKTITDIMATPEGRDYWKKNGESFRATFDMTPGSKSMKIFNAYLSAKGEPNV